MSNSKIAKLGTRPTLLLYQCACQTMTRRTYPAVVDGNGVPTVSTLSSRLQFNTTDYLKHIQLIHAKLPSTLLVEKADAREASGNFKVSEAHIWLSQRWMGPFHVKSTQYKTDPFRFWQYSGYSLGLWRKHPTSNFSVMSYGFLVIATPIMWVFIGIR